MRSTLIAISALLCATTFAAAPAIAAEPVYASTAAMTAQPSRSTTSVIRTLPIPTTTITIRVVGGRPVGGIKRPKLKKGQRVVLVVRSSIADEVHLHGYDLSRRVAARRVARIAFVAKIAGRFEVELEESGIQLAELTVR